ncbi:methylated-DNA-(Protein)-cysteineS-methyltransferase DNA binding [Striga asiatica]|uniref:Methylated-DNA-(Protein)-cysteineS-methyltransferase DNA binding n=1 Tax=Striga asiatica TaxID=4170 RepID=A0A5A7PFR8_STRAF|nr:methylated-DNA-(Protein)-cysteineS-methyltransferase DNA binding [Striga asiatica]
MALASLTSPVFTIAGNPMFGARFLGRPVKESEGLFGINGLFELEEYFSNRRWPCCSESTTEVMMGSSLAVVVCAGRVEVAIGEKNEKGFWIGFDRRRVIARSRLGIFGFSSASPPPRRSLTRVQIK